MTMGSQQSEEKVKPFRLVKYFTYTSIIVIFMGTLLLSVLNTHWARTMQRQKSEEYALLLVENLNHQIFLRFIVPVAMKYGRIRLREKEQFELMDQVVRTTLHSFKVDMINIFGEDNIISYSFDDDMIGVKGAGGSAYKKAISGKASSSLNQRGNFLENLLGFSKATKLITFAPLRAEKRLSKITGPVLGVVEIIQDLTEEYKTIFRFQILVVTTCAVVMGMLLLILIFVVKRGEHFILLRALEKQRLEEQLSRAERLSSMGEMAAGISHEIRNPLGIIRSSAELLKKKMACFDPANTIPTVIVEETERLNNIITDFINYAKPKSPNRRPVRISELVDKNINFLASQMKQQGYRVIRHYENDLPEIMADSAMLYQAFFNIFINAMQAMPGGGDIRVYVRLNKKGLQVVFEDEGQGISQDALNKIWEPFFTTKEQGTGLGLGVVKNIIDAHGGTIQIENKPDKGVQVTVELPFEPEE